MQPAAHIGAYSRAELSSAIDALSEDWLNVSTFVEIQFESSKARSVTEQLVFLENFLACVQEPRHVRLRLASRDSAELTCILGIYLVSYCLGSD